MARAAIETTDIDMADAPDRIKEHRERKERLEDAAGYARAVLSQRRAYLDDVNTIAAYAKDMKDFLEESELTERRAFIESFVKEIIVIPGDALIRYTMDGRQSTRKIALLVGSGTWVGVSRDPASRFRPHGMFWPATRITSGDSDWR